jgi:hypothetical protein
MTNERYNKLMESDTEELTAEELKQGWHFCYELDGLLRNNSEGGFQCTCLTPQPNL